MEGIITQAQYARRKEVTRQYIYKLVNQGKLKIKRIAGTPYIVECRENDEYFH